MKGDNLRLKQPTLAVILGGNEWFPTLFHAVLESVHLPPIRSPYYLQLDSQDAEATAGGNLMRSAILNSYKINCKLFVVNT